jgi:cleavage and polyadenylation specificity factor subunit 1
MPYNVVPFANIDGLTGAFVTGEKPHWILASDTHPVKAFGLKQAAFSFGKTTHLGGRGEYFIRIEDVSRSKEHRTDLRDPSFVICLLR